MSWWMIYLLCPEETILYRRGHAILYQSSSAVPTALVSSRICAASPADRIPGSWILRVSNSGVLSDVISQVIAAAGVGATAKHTYNFGSFKAFTIDSVPDLSSIAANIDNIESTKQDTVVRTSALVIEENVPSYGLARISSLKNGVTSCIYDFYAGK
jgi:hypothetical protein